MIHKPTTEEELNKLIRLKSVNPGDTIVLPSKLQLNRIIKLTDVNIVGEGDHPLDTVLYPQQGQAFRLTSTQPGSVRVENLTTVGGGTVFDIDGDGAIVTDVISIKGNKPFKFSGDNHQFLKSLMYQCEVNGVEINGGFYNLFGIEDIRLKREIGLIPNQPPQHTWTSTQLEVLKDLYFNRDMNFLMDGVAFVECGAFGGNTYGGAAKLVPAVGGVTLRNNIGYKNLNFLWIDTPSSVKNVVHNNYAFETLDDAYFFEIGVNDSGKVDFYDNFSWGVNTAMFNSTVSDIKSWGNELYFRNIGKWVNGVAGVREDFKLSQITPDGKTPDKVISMDPVLFKAYTGKHQRAVYDMDKDVRLYLEEPLFGNSNIEATNAQKFPLVPTTASKTEWPSVPQAVLDHPYIPNRVLLEIKESMTPRDLKTILDFKAEVVENVNVILADHERRITILENK